MFGLLLVGKPVPLHVTVMPESAHPATCKLAGLIVTPPACRSAIAFGMLFAQSPVARKRQLPAVGIETIDGLVMPPNEFPTSYIWPSKAPKKKTLSLTIAPPTLPPYCSSVVASLGLGAMLK